LKANWPAHLALFFANLIYGLNYTIAKGIMPEYIDPSGFILLRVLGAAILFWLTQLFLKTEKILAKDHLLLALCALFGVATNQLLFFNGLSLTTPINAAIIMTSNPILVLIIASIIIKERITVTKAIGVLLGAVGAIFLISANTGIQSDAQNPALGNFMVLLNAASYGVYLVLVKPLMAKYSPLTVIKWVFTYGLIMVIPFGFGQFSEINWAMPSNIWWGIAFVVVGTTYLAYLFNIFALKKVNPTTVSFYIYLQPLLGSLFAIILGKDHLQMHMIIAAALIFTGVYLVSKPKTIKA
jgi:drug/metabolite transporter (DMT)-like permease